ncbi:hypothetical protein [Micromonospora chokoriensis]|uniref:hypothetical protein n=1 Tax=Micromonospora chokoriensis TaxID=356851 RepID=UPI000A803AC9|nr:hypothetical protein [Micromonospora chokoriensis]
MTTPLPPVCRPCQDARDRWLDSRPSQVLPRLGFTYGSGARHDTTTAGIHDNHRSRYERWRQLVKSNRDLIARTCREQGHTEVPAEKVPAVIELPLLDLIVAEEAA